MRFRTNFALLFLFAALFTAVGTAQKPKSKDEALKEIAALVATKNPEDMAKAYPLGKDFVARFGKDNKDGKDKAVNQVKAFVEGYRENSFFAAVDGNKPADAFALGKDILAEHPDDVSVMINLAHAGYNSLGTTRNKTYANETISFAKSAAQAIESGTTPKTFAPYKDKDEALAWMYYIPGYIVIDTDYKEAAANIYKATTFNAPVKESSLPYYLIASYYEDVYAKLSTDLKAKVAAKTINDADFKTANDRITKAIELMMDAYARAFKKGEAEKNPNAAQWKERLTQVYKFSKKTEEGLPEFIKFAVLSPMPDPAKF
ncbi:MAG TPA: hypothetical protein PLP21_08010 [Pyrinomonadaceae bacterium]|nr:hypothetical protein [Acidobacteriota bacterium]HQZ96251.1 hypothetical protein [Pyrinomonadaceae bacterium]